LRLIFYHVLSCRLRSCLSVILLEAKREENYEYPCFTRFLRPSS
jgi:hypothetical protein